jgi:hypothetical protein
VALHQIAVPETIRELPFSQRSSQLIDTANDRIEAFMLADQRVIENFVTCDFHLVDQALSWINQNHMLTGDRFCEWGSGFGVVAMLAALRNMESVGIEIESVLVEQSAALATELDVAADFFCGSFVPRDADELSDLASEIRHVDTEPGDVYQEIELDILDFDLFFAFPWPGEHTFFEAVFQSCAADGALLLTYRGREGMHLVRKE